jgi:hypothetical protein
LVPRSFAAQIRTRKLVSIPLLSERAKKNFLSGYIRMAAPRAAGTFSGATFRSAARAAFRSSLRNWYALMFTRTKRPSLTRRARAGPAAAAALPNSPRRSAASRLCDTLLPSNFTIRACTSSSASSAAGHGATDRAATATAHVRCRMAISSEVW